MSISSSKRREIAIGSRQNNRLTRWFPCFAILGTYSFSKLGMDLLAGIALSAILVPAGMAYAMAAGLPAIYGLYATIVPLIVYAILGPSRILILGPNSTLAGLIAATILPMIARPMYSDGNAFSFQAP